jgi:hypothetical protein
MRHTSNRRRSESVRGIAYQRAVKASSEVFDRIDEENGVECPSCHAKIKVGPGGKLVKHAQGGSKVQEKYGRPACLGGGPNSEPVVDPNPQPPRYSVAVVPRPPWLRERDMGAHYTGHGTVHLYEVITQRRAYLPATNSSFGHWGWIPKSKISFDDYAQVACDGNQDGVTAACCFKCHRTDLPGCEHTIATLKFIRDEVEDGIEWVPMSGGELRVQVVRACKPAPSNTEPTRLFMWLDMKKRLKVGDRIEVPWPKDEAHPWGDDSVAEVVVIGLGSRGQETRVHKIKRKIEEES